MTMTTKHYLQQFALGSAGFVVVLILGTMVNQFLDQSYQQKIVLILSVFPGIYAGLNLTRALMSLDELQQRIQLEALGFSLANTVFVALIIGLMQMDFMDSLNMACIIPIIGLWWLLGLRLAKRRYQ